jgi:hypothetical protein
MMMMVVVVVVVIVHSSEEYSELNVPSPTFLHAGAVLPLYAPLENMLTLLRCAYCIFCLVNTNRSNNGLRYSYQNIRK